MKLTIEQQQWVDALRSGNYKQTCNSILKEQDQEGNCSYCCLGVAQEMYQPDAYALGINRGQSRLSYPTHELAEILHLYQIDGSVIGDSSEIGHHASLAAANDDGYSFQQIADFIEQNPEKVFAKGAE